MRVNFNGTDIYFEIVNSGSAMVEKPVPKPTVFALHGGLGLDHGYLRPGLDPLADIARIVYVDLRGQGRSGRPSLETCTLEQMADDVVDLAVMLDVERPIILGHSAGGFVAMKAAVRHPELVGGLILAGTVPTLKRSEGEKDPADPKLSDRASAEALAAAERYYTTPLTPRTVEDFFTHVRPLYAAQHYVDSVTKLMSLSTVEFKMLQHFRNNLMPTYDVREALSAVRCPTLVLSGSYDWVCPPSAGRDIASRIKGSEYVEFTNSGHFFFSEEPQTFQTTASKFLKGFAEAFTEEMA
ncbi:proline iminopeptidase [Rhizobium sp. NFR07]|uniref:alpha/beta fold hydrolase n=1 Tax=Rhizobium sp. NFR07 TaxID=1566262 RepID=UPI0008E99B49|nr:alpha/beta hydrolase [Rhizobium sp. NFR07]SFB58386.1 proline iminopeptidase [Rhizobium sp. NFR07]